MNIAVFQDEVKSLKRIMFNVGYSLIELLIVLVILSILGAGIFSAYTLIGRENAYRHLVAKQETDVSAILSHLFKDIGAAGFGIDLNINTTKTVVTDNSITGCTFTFPSLASRQEKWSGCWGIVKGDGTILFKSQTFMNNPCTVCSDVSQCMKTNNWYVMIDPVTKENLCGTNGKCNCGAGNTCYPKFTGKLAFYATHDGSYVYPDSFMVTYNLSQMNLPKECAPGTYNLVKTIGTSSKPGYSPNQPVVSCVFPGSFRIRDGDKPSELPDFKRSSPRIKFCIILQVGPRENTPTDKPNFYDCGEPLDFNETWWLETGKWYRWKVIEQDFVLRNY